ncbi:MAG: hypothetical protein WD273_09815 [Trueperaceae bacterium]
MPTFVPTRQPEPILGTRILEFEARSDLQVVERLADGLGTHSREKLAEDLGLSVARVLDLSGIKSSTSHERKKCWVGMISGIIIPLSIVARGQPDRFQVGVLEVVIYEGKPLIVVLGPRIAHHAAEI